MKYLSFPAEQTKYMETSLPVPDVVGIRIFFRAGLLTTFLLIRSSGVWGLVAMREVSLAISMELPPPSPMTRSDLSFRTIS